MLFICYSRCTTCKKAQQWLDDQGANYTRREIKDEPPTEAELRKWVQMSGLPLKRFWNTSGIPYRELGLKDKLPTMPEDEQFALLSTDGMIVKRPLLVGDSFVLIGFKEAEWVEKLL